MKCSADVSATRSKSRSRFRQAQLHRSRLIYTRRTTRSKKAIASWCKCKAPGFPSSTATRRNSFPTFLRRKNPTTRRPRSASTVRNGFLRASKFPFFLLLRPQPTELSLKGGLWLCGAGHMRLLRQTAQVRHAGRRRETHNVLLIVEGRANFGNQGPVLAESDRFQRGCAHLQVLVAGRFDQGFGGVGLGIVGQFLCCRRTYRRRIVLCHCFEDLIADPSEGHESNSLLKAHLGHLFLVLQGVQLLSSVPRPLRPRSTCHSRRHREAEATNSPRSALRLARNP